MEQIHPGIYSLPLAFDWQGTEGVMYPTAVETESGLLLVDTGFPDHAAEIRSQLAESGYGLADVTGFLITHHDPDHAGGLHDLAADTPAPVFAHPDEIPYIVGAEPLLKGGEYPPARVDVELRDGLVFRTAAGPMRVVESPGHTPGHVSLYFPDQRLLLAADAITAMEAFDGPTEEVTPDMPTAIESIGRLAELDVEQTFCFHGGLVTHDRDRIAEMYDDLA